MRDDLRCGVGDDELVRALRSTSILLSSDEINASSHSAQSAIVTVALLTARSGLDVWIDVPDIDLVGPQPPLKRQPLRSGLLEVGDDLIPDVPIRVGRPAAADLVLLVGDTPAPPGYGRKLRLNANDWAGWIGNQSEPWNGDDWPFGGLAVASMAGAEAIKVAMRKLAAFAAPSDNFARYYAATDEGRVDLARATTEKPSGISNADLISAGAIANAALYALLRVPNVTGSLRVVEPQKYDPTNLNRCMLLRRSRIEEPKAVDVARFGSQRLAIQPIVKAFQEARQSELQTIAQRVLVGVDHIATRWDVQAAAPGWVGIGATSHWSAMASYHLPGVPCARCLHDRNEDRGDIVPTISFVSFSAGLWLASLFLQDLAGEVPESQQVYLAPLALGRPSAIWRSPIPWSGRCPSHRYLA